MSLMQRSINDCLGEQSDSSKRGEETGTKNVTLMEQTEAVWNHT